MKKVTINSLFKDVYNLKEITIFVIMSAAGIYLCVKYKSIIGILGLLMGMFCLNHYVKMALNITKGNFVILKQKVSNISKDSIFLNAGRFDTNLLDSLREDDEVYIVYEGCMQVMLYNANGVILDENVSKHLLTGESAINFIENLRN